MNKGVLIAIAVAVALAVQIALAVFFWSSGDDDADPAEEMAAPTKALYHNLRPPFVVTLPYGGRHYMLQADLALMAHDPGAIEAALRHAPLVRAEVVSFLTDLDPQQVRSKEGKRELLEALRDLINATLKRERETAAIDSVLFNNLVMQ